MLQFDSLSNAARTIVDTCLFGMEAILTNKREHLVASLYATLSNAVPEVINVLKPIYLEKNKINLTELEWDILKDEAVAVIQYCYKKASADYAFSASLQKTGYTIPDQVMELCEKLVRVDEKAEICLPFSAYSQFAFTYPERKYYGFNVDALTWAFTHIYLQCFRIDAKISLCELNGIPAVDNRKYDIVFSFPPVLRAREQHKVVDILYNLATKSLKENGTFFCIVPTSFCNDSSGWFNVRKILWDYRKDYSATVIALPKGVFLHTQTSFCLFMLTKDGKGEVTLMDATSDYFCLHHTMADQFVQYLNAECVMDSFTKSNNSYVWKGTTSDLTNNVDLSPSRYLFERYKPEVSDGEEVILLDEIIEVMNVRTLPDRVEYKLIDSAELSSNYLKSDISGSRLQPISLPPRVGARFRKIDNNNCLLFSYRGAKAFVGKLTDFDNNDIVVVSDGIIPFVIKDDTKVSEEFLLRCLTSQETEKQLEMLFCGSVIPRIRKVDFLKLKIVVPSKETQVLLYKKDSMDSLSEADKKIVETSEDFRHDIHMKKHAIGQTIFNLVNWWNVMKQVREEGQGVVRDDASIGQTRKIKVSSIYDNIQNALDKLQQQINKFDRGNGLVVEDISLTDFIEKYIKEHESPLFQFQYDSTAHHLSGHQSVSAIYDEHGQVIDLLEIEHDINETLEHAQFAPEALTIVFDNIISNACSHGFVGRDATPEMNIIKIDLSTEGNDYVISISNNGLPPANNVSEKFVFTYDLSTQKGKNHYGIGGYEVKRLMQEFNGDAEFIVKHNNAFSVTYKLIFHDTNVFDPTI